MKAPYEQRYCQRIRTIRRVRQVGVERLTGRRVGRVQAQVVPVLTRGRLLFDALLVFVLLFVSALVSLLLRLALYLFHFRPLILEPYLDDSDAKPGVLCKSFAHFPTRFRADFEGGFELPALRRREDGPRALRASPAVARAFRVVYYHIVLRVLHQIHLLLEVLAAEDLARADHVLLALLQRLAAHDAHEALYVEHVLLRAHHHLLRQQPVAAARALHAEQPAPSGNNDAQLIRGRRAAFAKRFAIRSSTSFARH